VKLEVQQKKLIAGALRSYPIVAEHHLDELRATEESVTEWKKRGESLRVVEVGSVFGLSGKVIDTRRTLILLDGSGDPAWTRAADERVARVLGRPPDHYEALDRRPNAKLILTGAHGAQLGEAESLLSFELIDPQGVLEIEEVEFGVGYRWHGREKRQFRGKIHLVAGDGGMQVVNELGLERLLRGVVPAEIFASAQAEALAAQAVTARGEVLAKIGTRHLAEPALLCAEQHCQVFKGEGASTPATDRAVAGTRGQVLLGPDDHLIDAVYSAVCGGHTENNEVVWGGSPRSSLRGRTDFEPKGSWRAYTAGVGEQDLDRWFDEEPPAWCNLSSFRNPEKFRWTRRMTLEELDKRLAPLKVGHLLDLKVVGRGVSARLKALEIKGSLRTVVVHRELPVRKLLGNLNSGAFVIRRELDARGRLVAFVFRGAGWGHGVGLCQVGAIGMAEAGFDHRSILRHYFNGAHIAPIY